MQAVIGALKDVEGHASRPEHDCKTAYNTKCVGQSLVPSAVRVVHLVALLQALGYMHL